MYPLDALNKVKIDFVKVNLDSLKFNMQDLYICIMSHKLV
jgi:hypothetical protein